jgi:hypothetical protein
MSITTSVIHFLIHFANNYSKLYTYIMTQLDFSIQHILLTRKKTTNSSLSSSKKIINNSAIPLMLNQLPFNNIENKSLDNNLIYHNIQETISRTEKTK